MNRSLGKWKLPQPTTLNVNQPQSMIAESKRKKLMTVLNDLVELKKKLNKGD